jgi:hypothetical protein
MKCVNSDEEYKQIQLELKLQTEILSSDSAPIKDKLKATESALKLVKKQKEKQLAAYQEFARTGQFPVGLLKDKERIADPKLTSARIETLKSEIEHLDSRIEAFDYTKSITEEYKKQIATAERLNQLFAMLDSETYVEAETGVKGKKYGPDSQAVAKINDEIAQVQKALNEKFAEQIKLKQVRDEQIKVAVRIAELRGGIVEQKGVEQTAPTKEMATELQKLAELQAEEKKIRSSMERRTTYEENLVKEEARLLNSAKNRLTKALEKRDAIKRGEAVSNGKKTDVATKDRAAVEAEIKQARQEIKDLTEAQKQKPTQDEIDKAELQKQIDSIDKKILNMAQGTAKKPRGPKQMAVKEELMPLVEERNAKAKELADMQEAARPKAEKKPVKDAYQREIERKMRYKEELERRIKEGPKERKGKLQGPYTEERAKIEEEIIRLQAEQRDTDWFNQRNQESALKGWKTNNLKAIAFMQKGIEENDFSTKKKEKRQIELDDEAQNILQKRREMENQYRLAKEKAESEARTPAQKALDNINGFKRFSILSGPPGVFKLTSASFYVAANRAATESIGYGFSKIPLVSEIMKKDPFSSTYEKQKISRDMTLYVQGLVKGIKEFGSIVRGEGSSLSIKFGEESGVPQNWLGLFSRLHEAIKNPTKQANYDMGYARYLDWAESQGRNPENRDVISEAEIEAFKYANESIFKEDNWLVRKYQGIVQEARNSEDPMRRTLGFALEQTLPIVKIPSNIVKQTFEHMFGTLPATYKLIDAAVRGTENMSAQDAHILMRQMKRGSAGLLMMAMGVILKDYIGGLYIKGEEEGEIPYGSLGVGPYVIPKYLMENPLFACLQVGATAARFWENHYGEDDSFIGNVKLAAKMTALTSIGVVEEAPFVSAILNADKALRGAQDLETTLSEIYLRPYIPAGLQFVADIQDLDDGLDLKNKPIMENFATLMNRKATKRTPSDWFEAIELGIPFLRQNVQPR